MAQRLLTEILDRIHGPGAQPSPILSLGTRRQGLVDRQPQRAPSQER
jgi:hypothetical protein